MDDDFRGFETAYNEHSSPVRSFLRVYVGTAAAEDLTQDTFLHLWRKPGAFDERRSTLRKYLLGVARKKAAEWWRQHQRVQAIAPSTQSKDDFGTLMGSALERLEPNLRNILWLREVEGYSYDELAEILGVPVGTVKSRLFTAREQLRTIWNNRQETI